MLLLTDTLEQLTHDQPLSKKQLHRAPMSKSYKGVYADIRQSLTSPLRDVDYADSESDVASSGTQSIGNCLKGFGGSSIGT